MSLSLLFDHVKVELDAMGVAAVVAFGQRELAQQLGQGPGRANRVVIAPGDEGRALGSYGPPNKRGIFGSNVAEQTHPPRSLWTWNVAARVLVWAYDGDAPSNERRQWDALCDLHDSVVTAIHSFASGSYTLRAPRDPASAVERPFGKAVLLIVELAQHVVDVRQVERTGPLEGRGTGVLVTPTAEEETEEDSP
jgi:hypothetical protein